jgi:transposase InsO family protein
MAIATRKTNNLIHHSDQGIQYTCKEYINILKAHHIKISMSAKGNPYDNAFVESFFKTLKQEEVYLWEYETFSDVIERIPYFIEDVYNKKRLHSSLGYRPPEEYERLFAENDSQECIMAKTINV